MRKLLSLTLLLLVALPVLEKDNEAKIKAAVEDRYKEWLAAENKKDAEVLTSFTTRMRSSCPQRRSQ